MKDFAMFTVVGNITVAALVETAIENYRGFDWLQDQLMKLSEVSLFAEASDTAVREACYIALEEVDLV